MADWFRVPPWCMATHDEPAAVRARAWVYLLGAWHAGDDPSTREIRRVTGFGGGRADALVRDVLAWAIDNGARVPERVAGRERGGSGAGAGRLDNGSTHDLNEERGGSGAEAGRERGGSRARVPFPERDERSEIRDQNQWDESNPTPEADPDPRSTAEDRSTDTENTDAEEDPMQLFEKEIPAGSSNATAEETAIPSWTPKYTRPYDRADVAAMVLTVIAEVRRPSDLDPAAPTPPVSADVRCKGDAKTILALWSYLERPPIGDFARDLLAVVRAARSCPHRMFARDIRAEGWEGGNDRHRDLTTLCRRDRWQRRLEVARAWTEHPENVGPANGAPKASPPRDDRDVMSFFRNKVTA